jgi:hypothetical protein
VVGGTPKDENVCTANAAAPVLAGESWYACVPTAAAGVSRSQLPPPVQKGFDQSD